VNFDDFVLDPIQQIATVPVLAATGLGVLIVGLGMFGLAALRRRTRMPS